MIRPRFLRFVLVAVASAAWACAGAVIGPRLVPLATRADAVLVLPGFGYSPDGERVFRELAPIAARDGFDLFVANYVDRGGLEAGRAKLQRFADAHGLDRYERLHVFAFIAGAWTFNPIAERSRFSNLASVVYDRSPLQERAPRIALEHLRFLTWLRYGSPVFDVARTPYPPLTKNGVQVGLMIETRATDFVRERRRAAMEQGPLRFDCRAFEQRFDDCVYVAMNHDELYQRFTEVWPEVVAFARDGRFTGEANRTPPTADPFAP